MTNFERLDLANGLFDHAEGMMRRYYCEDDSELSDTQADRLIDNADKLIRIAQTLKDQS